MLTNTHAGFRLSEAGVNADPSDLTGYQSRVFNVLKSESDQYLRFWPLLTQVGTGTARELSNALYVLREAGFLTPTASTRDLSFREPESGTVEPEMAPEVQVPHDQKMARIRASLKRAVVSRRKELVDLSALDALIADHRILSGGAG